jgi:hypothetical protein
LQRAEPRPEARRKPKQTPAVHGLTRGAKVALKAAVVVVIIVQRHLFLLAVTELACARAVRLVAAQPRLSVCSAV